MLFCARQKGGKSACLFVTIALGAVRALAITTIIAAAGTNASRTGGRRGCPGLGLFKFEKIPKQLAARWLATAARAERERCVGTRKPK